MVTKLAAINAEMVKLVPELEAAIRKAAELEVAYDRRFFDLMLHSSFGNQASREGEARQIMETEGSANDYNVAKTDLKCLYNRRDLLVEISKNFRTLEMIASHSHED